MFYCFFNVFFQIISIFRYIYILNCGTFLLYLWYQTHRASKSNQITYIHFLWFLKYDNWNQKCIGTSSEKQMGLRRKLGQLEIMMEIVMCDYTIMSLWKTGNHCRDRTDIVNQMAI